MLARGRIPALLALSLATLGAAALPAQAQFPDGRPNVVVIMTDDQTVPDLKAMPKMRALIGDRGVTFRRNFVSYSLCCPSRATYLSGQYAHNHRVLGLAPPTGGYVRFDRFNDLPVWMQAAGYWTAHIGKYLNGYGTQVPADVPPGWDDWYGATDPSAYRMWGYQLDENGKFTTYGRFPFEQPALYQTDVLTQRALGVIDRRSAAGGPFYLSIAYLAPHREAADTRLGTGVDVRSAPRHSGLERHLKLPKDRSFNERDVSDKPTFVRHRRRLDAEQRGELAESHRARIESLLAVDDGVAAIMGELLRTGELANTYVIFTSDNGYLEGQHRLPSGKLLPYDPSTRVPLIVSGPGIPPASTSGELVGNTDLAPTLLELSGAIPGKTVDGRSLLSYARDPELRSGRPFLHETGGRRFLSGDDITDGETPAVRRLLTYQAVRTPNWLYVEYRGGQRELYYLKRDPLELSSKAKDPRYDRPRKALRKVLRRLRHCRGASCRRATPRIPAPARRLRRKAR